MVQVKTGFSLAGLAFLFLVNIGIMQDMVVLPAANEIFAAFPDAPMWVLNFILTGPLFLAMISQLAAGVLMKRFKKRTLLLAFWAVFTVAGVCGSLIENVWYVFAMRALSGFAIGGLTPLAIALITQQYADGKERGRIIGYFYVAMAVCGAIESYCSGWLAGVSWQHVYLLFLVAIPIFFGLLFTLPKADKEVSENEDDIEEAKRLNDFSDADRPKSPLLSAVSAGLGGAVVCMIYGSIVFQAALTIAELGIGGSHEAGLASSIATITAAVPALFFGKMFNKLARKTAYAIYFTIMVGLVMILVNPSLPVIYAAFAVMGLGYGVSMPYYSMKSSVYSVYGNNPVYISVVIALVSFGTAASSYFATWLMEVLHITSRVQSIPVLLVVMVGACALTLVCNLMHAHQVHRETKE